MINRIASLWKYFAASFEVRWTIKKYMVQFNLSLDEAVRYHFDIGEGRNMPCIYVDYDNYASSVDLHMATWSPDESCVVCDRELFLGPDEWNEEMFGSPA